MQTVRLKEGAYFPTKAIRRELKLLIIRYGCPQRVYRGSIDFKQVSSDRVLLLRRFSHQNEAGAQISPRVTV